MRAIVQRVHQANVQAGGKVVGEIGKGLLVYLGVGIRDSIGDAERLAEKVTSLRIFEDAQGKLNRSVKDVLGDILCISNFTLMADARKGRRPSFDGSASGQQAQPLYEAFLSALEKHGCPPKQGVFGEYMEISSVADGPINLIIDFPPLPMPGDK